MSKTVISQSDNLIKQRKSMLRKNVYQSILVGFAFFAIYLIYILLVCLGKGYFGVWDSVFGKTTFLKDIPYFDLEDNLFNWNFQSSMLRFFTLLGCFVISVILGVAFSKINYARLNKKYHSLYLKLLIEEAKINGMSLSIESQASKDEDEQEKEKNTLEMLNVSSPEFSFLYESSTPMTSLLGRQYRYIRDGRKRDGMLLLTEIPLAKSHSFIELRTFGEPQIHQYQGLPIKKYGFGNVSSLSNFVCYTTLGQEIYLVIDKKVADALSSLAYFVKTDIAVLVIGEKLSIFLDGFKLDLVKDLNYKLPNQILETQAEALVALHQCITQMSIALSGEVNFSSEEKGNGILSY